MSNQPYTSFVPHEDNVNEPVSASDINELQTAVQGVEANLISTEDADFEQSAVFALQSHPIANALIVDLFADDSHVDYTRTTGLRYDSNLHSMVFDAYGVTTGVLTTKMFLNQNNKSFQSLFLLTNEYLENTVSISKYEYSYDGVTFTAFTPNSDTSAPNSDNSNSVYVMFRFTFTRTDTTQIGRLDGWAFLYLDDAYSFHLLDTTADINLPDNWDGTITS